MQPITDAPTATTAFLGMLRDGPVRAPAVVASFAEFEATFGGLWSQSDLPFAIRDFFANGGAQAVITRLDAPASAADLTLLAGVDFQLLCQPDGIAADQAAVYCEDRRAFLIFDVADVAGVSVSSPNAAGYFPRLMMPDPFDANRLKRYSALGAVAGVMARVDLGQGVWKAPAGRAAGIRGTAGYQVLVSSQQATTLTLAGVNALRSMPGTDEVLVWGARTRSSDALWKYVNVRRFALFLEQSIRRGTQETVFQPNGEPLWAQLRATVGEFLLDLWRRGALQGNKAEQAFFVRTGRETTTQADLDQGAVNVLVGFAPLKAAEFVLVEIRLATAG